MGLEGFLEQGGQGGGEVFSPFQAVSEPFQLLGHHGVEDDVGPGDRVRGAYHPELKFVAGEGHGGGAVAVGVVLADVGQGGQAHVQHPLAQIHMVRALQEGVNHLGELVPQEDRDHRRGCLLGAQTVVVARGGHGGPQKPLVFVHPLDKGGQEKEKLEVLAGGGTGLEEVLAGVRGQGPVVVLAGAIDPFKRLFVDEAHQPVAVGHLFQQFHGQLVVVAGGVGVAVDGGHFVLGGGHLVVLGFGGDPYLPQLLVQILHELGHPGLDHAEVVVLHLLPPGRVGPEEGAAGQAQVPPSLVEGLVDEKVLLLRSHLGSDLLGLGVPEEAEDTHRLAAHRLHGAQQGHLLVQGLAGVGTEDGGDVQGALLHKGKGGGVPGGVPPGFEGAPQSPGGEGGGVRLSPDELLARELQQYLAAAVGVQEAVVLFRGGPGHGLEPVGEVGGP